jgi:hypothetical protein
MQFSSSEFMLQGSDSCTRTVSYCCVIWVILENDHATVVCGLLSFSLFEMRDYTLMFSTAMKWVLGWC